ncbi:MAG: FAD-binding and (Fe-S)-binding domain-containing protein [Beutenbergiaceae bacterium]
MRAPSEELLAALAATGARVGSRATDRLAAAHDASHYLLTPQAVVTPSSTEQVAAVLATASQLGVPVTFRSGGTSLSGQAGSDGVLIDTRRHFRGIEVLKGGQVVRTGPGATVRAVNNRLRRYGRKLGPDPASEIACTIGGVIANNSSGMACGTHANSYRTLDSAVLVLPSGTTIDTADPDADSQLRQHEPELHAGLSELRERVRTNPDSMARIAALYAIKNTMGYGVNAFVDFDRPIDILAHLVVGSEGTLAFVAQARFRTVPHKPHAATGLLIFPDLTCATSALPALVAAGLATIELMDATSLRVAQRDPAAPPDLLELDVVDHAALLVEYQHQDQQELEGSVAGFADVVREFALAAPASLSSDPARRAALWQIRKGLFTLVAGARRPGTTALLEDIAVPVARLNDTCQALIGLFQAHDYQDAVIFGHAKDGNIHFLLNENFEDPVSLARYQAFTEDMVNLVLSHGGTLKAEHGTGRIMAPFVRRQVGDELYQVMQQVKGLVDPQGLLNPGVLLTDLADAHIRDLKLAPAVEAEVDRCVECGYCEPVCPSKDLTLTPRERIVLRREIERADQCGDRVLASTLRQEYDYDGIDTCAVDGMCQTACPVLINTGDLVRRLRAENAGKVEQGGWNLAAKHWGATTGAASAALTVARGLPAALPKLATSVGRAVLGAGTVPQYAGDLPGGGSKRVSVNAVAPEAIYFSSCTATMFGPAPGGDGVAAAFLRLCERAGVRLATPPDLPSLCCGTPWKSKGLTDGYRSMRERVQRALSQATGATVPVVCDASSCTEGLEVLLESAHREGIEVIDAVAFVAQTVLPRLPQGQRLDSLTIHPTCSSTRLGLNDSLSTLAEAVADNVVIPDDWGCCGFAGDRGMLHPELTASATAAQAEQVRQANSSAHASTNRTCEIGMSRATGFDYRHILELLDQVTAG